MLLVVLGVVVLHAASTPIAPIARKAESLFLKHHTPSSHVVTVWLRTNTLTATVSGQRAAAGRLPGLPGRPETAQVGGGGGWIMGQCGCAEQSDRLTRPIELGAKAEDAAIGSHEPVPARTIVGRHSDYRRVQRRSSHRTVELCASEGEYSTV